MIRNKIIVVLAIVLFIAVAINVIKTETSFQFPVLSGSQKEHYDLIVYGAEPEGIAAATVAAEKGLSVLLIEERSQIGGLMTLGGLNFIDMNYDSEGTLLTQGIFKRFYDEVGGNAFDIDKAIFVFSTFLYDAGVDVLLDSKVTETDIYDSVITGIQIETPEENIYRTADFFIDCSTDGVLAAMAGVPYTIFGEDIGKPDRLMGVTLVFTLDDVRWGSMFTHLNSQRLLGKLAGDERQYYGARLKTAWGYSVEGYQYQPKDQQMRLRGLNVARQNDGSVLINALIIFDVDPLDAQSKAKAFQRAEKELEYVVPYLNDHFKGFEKAVLSGTAEELYVRESRHFLTKYIVTIDDVLENRSFDDQIAIGSYPVDIQPAKPGDWGTIVGNPDKYGIPFRTLLPETVGNLLLAGKHAGYSSLAAGSARVIPIGMVTAEAAALAAVMASEKETDFEQIANQGKLITELRQRITDNGGYVEVFHVENPLAGIKGYEQMKDLRRLGLVAGGYQNQYHFDAIIDKWKYDQMMKGILEYHQLAEDFIEIDLYPNYGSIPQIFYQIMYRESVSIEEAWTYCQENLLFDQLDHWITTPASNQPTVAEVYIFLSNINDYLAKKI